MKLFEYENVKLRFSDDALEAIAELALERKIGARGLRMIIEDLMLDLMYQVPNQKKLREVTITREIVVAKDKPDRAHRKSRIGTPFGFNPSKSTKHCRSFRSATSSSFRT